MSMRRPRFRSQARRRKTLSRGFSPRNELPGKGFLRIEKSIFTFPIRTSIAPEMEGEFVK